MFFPPRKDATEREFYLKDYTVEEQEAGKADHVIKFAAEAECERGASMRKGNASTANLAELENGATTAPEEEKQVAAPEDVKVQSS